jgi:hypothetical protein
MGCGGKLGVAEAKIAVEIIKKGPPGFRGGPFFYIICTELIIIERIIQIQ